MHTGTVEHYFEDIKMGRIAGPEGKYTFRRVDWLSASEPAPGMTVNFEPVDGRAIKVSLAGSAALSAGVQ